MSASKITGIPFQEFLEYPEKNNGASHPLRKKIGKVAELASGYQGWINAWKHFGADKHFNNDKEIKKAILKWRADSPAIVEFWGDQYRRIGTSWDFRPERYGVEGAVVNAIQTPFTWFPVRSVAFLYREDVDVLYCKLPSGGHLHYHQPRLVPTIHRLAKMPSFQITHMGWNSDSERGPVGWIRMTSWGGKFVENITQRAARDIFGGALVRLEKHGYPVVLHSHDEPVCEVPEGHGSISIMERLMTSRPQWCLDWPIKVGGSWRGKRYFKS
jgi:DNA polymerase